MQYCKYWPTITDNWFEIVYLAKKRREKTFFIFFKFFLFLFFWGGVKIFKITTSFLGRGHWKYDIIRYGGRGGQKIRKKVRRLLWTAPYCRQLVICVDICQFLVHCNRWKEDFIKLLIKSFEKRKWYIWAWHIKMALLQCPTLRQVYEKTLHIYNIFFASSIDLNKMQLKIFIKSTKSSWNLNCPTDPVAQFSDSVS